MSSASLLEKRSSRNLRARHTDSASSITSRPSSTVTSRSDTQSSHRMKEQQQPQQHRRHHHDTKQRESNLLDKSPHKRTRASNYELNRSDAHESDALGKIKKSTVGNSVSNLQTAKHAEPHDVTLDQLRQDSSLVTKMRIQAENDLKDLKRQYHEFQQKMEKERQNPSSNYDDMIQKQQHFNETMNAQVTDAKDKLRNITESLKTIRACGKDCDIHIRDLLIDYDCITKGELSKEVKRFQRLEIDLKNSLDRLHWRMDCEQKMYQNFIDQFHKLQLDLYYLKNATP